MAAAGTDLGLDLFYSRRIGIGESGEPIPIIGGGRLTGAVGGVSLGLLSIQTDDVEEAAIPMKEGAYDMEMLSKLLMRLKAQFPEKEDATILLEPDIQYDYLIQIMDAVRGTQIVEEGSDEMKQLVFFPDISIGDAP